MRTFAVTCYCCCILLYFSAVKASEWHYGEEEQWPVFCREGRQQSPIPLSDEIATDVELGSLIFDKYYGNKYPANVKNNGHSAEVRLHVENQPEVRGGGLPELYTLDHLHFHWQSEHTIEGYRYPLELHLVHYAKQYRNLTNALKYKNGVAVLSVLFDLSPDNDREFEPLIALIDKLHDTVDTIEPITVHLSAFLPRDTAGFYLYNGSLTTPNCNEGVIWTVFTNVLPISSVQVKSFSAMQTKEHKGLPKNYRSLQEINDRPVYHKVSPMRHSGANTITFNAFLIILVISFFKFH